MTFTQENRLLSVKTPLGADELLLTGFSGIEGISMPFSFELELLSENNQIAFKDIIGQNVTVTVALADGEKRYINGFISHFSQARTRGESDQVLHTAAYRATMVSWLWFLTRSVDSRIFQELSVVQIVEKVFRDRGFSDFQTSGLTGSYGPKDYCVQYHETDLHFVSRLLEQEGIFYFFKHEDGKHTLVLADSSQEHKPCPHQETVHCQQSAGEVEEEDVITGLTWMQEIRHGKYTTKDYNYLSPGTDLKAEASEGKAFGPGVREFYDFPGEYATRNEGDRLANLRMQAEEARVTTMSGSSNCRALTSGYRVTLRDYLRNDMNNKPYVLTMVHHTAGESVAGSDNETVASYSNDFTCIPFDVPYRPPSTSPKPVIAGVQTAVVTGPAGEEIYTDRHGRVKVQFHWDREGKNDDKTTCWIRVAQMWAGQGWGSTWIPRIGHEVVVSFVEGDPDRPLIMGSVYNGLNMPPYQLPDEKTKSTVKSYSSKGGGGFNEIRFEDNKGEEQVFIHAERRQDNRVKGDSLEFVGNDRHLMVKNDQFEKVGGDKHLQVAGDQNEKVQGTASLDVGTDIQRKSHQNYALDAGTEIHLKAGMNVVIESGTTLTLKVGGNFVNINSGGVFIQGSMVMINSGGAPGSGAGSSPTAPVDPEEADSGRPGRHETGGGGEQ